MLVLDNISDFAFVARQKQVLLDRVSLAIPAGRYAVLASVPELRRPFVDLLCGARPPYEGQVLHAAQPSWPIGRVSFVRGRLTGFQVLALIAGIYRLDYAACCYLMEEILTRPDQLGQSIEIWTPGERQEFGYSVGLLPSFGIYFVDYAMPALNTPFARRWHLLFEQRLSRNTFFLSTSRPKDVIDHCHKALVLTEGRVLIEDQVEKLLEQYPLRSVAADPERAVATADDDPLLG